MNSKRATKRKRSTDCPPTAASRQATLDTRYIKDLVRQWKKSADAEDSAAAIAREATRFVKLVCKREDRAWKAIVVFVGQVCGVSPGDILYFLTNETSPQPNSRKIVDFMVSAKKVNGPLSVLSGPQLSLNEAREHHPFVKLLTTAIGDHSQILFGSEDEGLHNGIIIWKLVELLRELSRRGDDVALRACSVLIGSAVAAKLASVLDDPEALEDSWRAAAALTQYRTAEAKRAKMNAQPSPSDERYEQNDVRNCMSFVLDALCLAVLVTGVNDPDERVQLWSLEGIEDVIGLHFDLIKEPSRTMMKELAHAVAAGVKTQPIAKCSLLKAAVLLKATAEMNLDPVERTLWIAQDTLRVIISAFRSAVAGLPDAATKQDGTSVDYETVIRIISDILKLARPFFSEEDLSRVTEAVGCALVGLESDVKQSITLAEFLIHMRGFREVDDEAFPKYVVSVFRDLPFKSDHHGAWKFLSVFCKALVLAGEERMLKWDNFYGRFRSGLQKGTLTQRQVLEAANAFKVSSFVGMKGPLLGISSAEEVVGKQDSQVLQRANMAAAEVQPQLGAGRRALVRFMAATVLPDILKLELLLRGHKESAACLESVLALDGLLIPEDWHHPMSNQEADADSEMFSEMLGFLITLAMTAVRGGAPSLAVFRCLLENVLGSGSSLGFPPAIRKRLQGKLVEVLQDLEGEVKKLKDSAENAVKSWNAAPNMAKYERGSLRGRMVRTASDFTSLLAIFEAASEVAYPRMDEEFASRARSTLSGVFDELRAWLPSRVRHHHLGREILLPAVTRVIRVQGNLLLHSWGLLFASDTRRRVEVDAVELRRVRWVELVKDVVVFRTWLRTTFECAARIPWPSTETMVKPKALDLARKTNAVRADFENACLLSLIKLLELTAAGANGEDADASRELDWDGKACREFIRVSLDAWLAVGDRDGRQMGESEGKLLDGWLSLCKHGYVAGEELGLAYARLDMISRHPLLLDVLKRRCGELLDLDDGGRAGRGTLMHAEGVALAAGHVFEANYAPDSWGCKSRDANSGGSGEAKVHKHIESMLSVDGGVFPSLLTERAAPSTQEFLITALKDMMRGAKGTELKMRRPTLGGDCSAQIQNSSAGSLHTEYEQRHRRAALAGLFPLLTRHAKEVIQPHAANHLLSLLDREFPKPNITTAGWEEKKYHKPVAQYRSCLARIAAAER